MAKRRNSRALRADAGPTDLEFVAVVNIQAAAAADAAGQAKPRRIEIDAYDGGLLVLEGWPYPGVAALQGMSILPKAKIYLDHDRSARVGHVENVRVEAGALKVTGLVSSQSAVAREVVADADNGYPWEASIGARTSKREFIPQGRKVQVNGREFAGPVLVAWESVLWEVSFVGSGAGDSTAARIAARAAKHGDIDMKFSEWLKAHGWPEEDKLSAAQKTDLQAAFDAEEAGDDDAQADAEAKKAAARAAATAAEAARIQAAARAGDVGGRIDREIAEINRKDAIEELAVKYVRGNPDRAEAIKATMALAIEGNWTVEKTDTELLRDSRRLPPEIRQQEPMPKGCEIEAALALAGGIHEPEKHYPAEVLNRAQSRFPKGLALGETLIMAARERGWHGHSLRGNLEGVLRACFAPREIQAGFSTVDVGGILSAVSNKFLLQGFFAVERTWRNICAVRNVPDFKTMSSYRLIGKEQYEKVGPTGEIQHGDLGEETYTNKADTYGLMLQVSRQDVINDDLGAITTVPKKLGRGSGLKINDVFWTIFMANTAFFNADDSKHNYISGAATNLGPIGLTTAEAKFLDMVDAKGKPIGVMPAILLVPTALSAQAEILFKSLEVRDTTATTKYATANAHQGKFRPEVSRYLGNASYPGNSATAFYLLANPDDLAVIEVAFLDGAEAPTIETAQADFNVLGIQMRGYHDFGVALQDPKGGVMSKGAA